MDKAHISNAFMLAYIHTVYNFFLLLPDWCNQTALERRGKNEQIAWWNESVRILVKTRPSFSTKMYFRTNIRYMQFLKMYGTAGIWKCISHGYTITARVSLSK